MSFSPAWSKRVRCSHCRHLRAPYQASTLHGFAGFFDSRLFADIHISIVPTTFSEVRVVLLLSLLQLLLLPLLLLLLLLMLLLLKQNVFTVHRHP